MAEKITAKNNNISQIGLNTHNQGHEINPVALSTTKISTKATTGSIPGRLIFFSIRISASKFPFFSDYSMAQTSRQLVFVELPKFQPATYILNRDAKNPLLTTLPRSATIKCNETVDAGVKTAVHAQRVWIAESQAERKLLNGPRRAQ